MGTSGPSTSRVVRGLPPGQHRRRDFPRFGMPQLAPPAVPDRPILTVAGAVEDDLHLPLTELDRTIPRIERVADLHCVATWTATGLKWSGVSFRQFWEQVVEPRCKPAGAVAIIARGADGGRAVLDLRDALADDVMLADRLDGEPLDALHGAPLRLVSPGQYGYKNIKHLRTIEVCDTFPRLGYKGMEHPRARVDREERHPRFAGPLLRLPYRATVPLIVWLNRRPSRAPGS
ncbi:molybdopterin-dependent oxidoreductase [Pseudonocardia sp. CA-107938]|uniref:molybdopterin-dependent oxidoreductase n=1 Tax=Pseudonocardia sp. CA-107938 TaxID=3240021 RepID=UPI003D9315E9